MIQVEGAHNFHNYQIQVWKTVEETGPTRWYTHVLLGETCSDSELDFFIGVSGTSKGQVLLETGRRLAEYCRKK